MISSTTRVAGPYAGTGAQTTFPFSFKVFQNSDVLVLQTDASGNITTLALTSQYSVALNSSQDTTPGGSITLVTALPTGYSLVMSSQVPRLQSTNLTNAGNFYPSVINNALDYLTILVQQLYTALVGALRFPIGDSATNSVLPSATSRANNLLGFDTNGNPIAIAATAQSATALTLALAASGGAATIGNTPAGGIASATVQAALNELDTKKQPNIGYTPLRFVQTRNDTSDLNTYIGSSGAYTLGSSNTNTPASYGNLLQLNNSDVNTQIYMPYTGPLYFRGAASSTLVGTAWRTVWDNVNLTNISQLINNSAYITSAPVIGIGQIWRDVTASRALATTYTNSNSKPILVLVSIYLSVSSTTSTSSFSVGGVIYAKSQSDNNSGTDHNTVVYSVLIPAGSTYSVASTQIILQWSELS